MKMFFNLNTFIKNNLFKSIIRKKMYFTINGCCYAKQIHYERKYRSTVNKSRKIFERSSYQLGIKPSNYLSIKENYRCFSSDYSDIDFENVDMLEEKLTSNVLRNILFPNSDDPVIKKINESSNVQQLFNTVHEYIHEFNSERCAQTILVIWDLQKQCRSSENYNDIYISRNELFNTYMNELRCHDMFLIFLDLLNKHFHGMSPDALSCTILYLTRMGIDYKHKVIQNLISQIDSALEDMKPGEFPMSALSRYILALGGVNRYVSELSCKLSLTKVFPHVQYYLTNCENASDFKYITICLYSLSSVLPVSLLEQYQILTDNFIETNKFCGNVEDSISALMKAVSLFSFYNFNSNILWKKLHVTILNLLKLISCNVDKIVYFQHFYRLQKVFLYVLEPVSLENELKHFCSHWVEKSDLSEADLTEISPELLFCLVTNTSLYKQHRFTDAALELIDKATKLHDFLVLSSNQLRSLTALNKKLWQKLLAKLKEKEYLRNIDSLIFLAVRYMEHVTQNRDREFEQQLMMWLLDALCNTSAFYEPKKLARSAVFILSFPEYFQHCANKYISLEGFIEKLLNNTHQFNVIDCLNVSRGYMEISNNREISSKLMHHYVRLDMELTNRTLQLLEETSLEDPSIHDLNILLRSYVSRRGSRESYLLRQIIERFKNVKKGEISSRSLRNSIYNLYNMDILIPDLMDKFCDYIVLNRDIVIGSTVSKLLYCVFIFDYYPKNEQFLTAACDIITRDFDKLPGLTLLQAALALSSFNCLNDFLIKNIFSIDFLDQLDCEIKHGYSKFSYPGRIRKCLMELNRSVCLDYPEAHVPWFHTKFCQQEAVSGKKIHSAFNRDVYQTLLTITKDSRLIQCSVMSSYGHAIDFQVCLDSNGNTVPYTKGIDHYLKLAVILNTESDYTIYVKRLKGPQQLQQKHLEMLGYRVIQIDQSLWNSMYMSEPKAKQAYLKELIKNNQNVLQT